MAHSIWWAHVPHIALLLCPAIAMSQVPTKNARAKPQAITEIIAEAKAADSPVENYKYAKRLTDWFVTKQTGDAYLDAFSERLTKADLMARHHEREWISESTIVDAYNYLLKQAGGNSSNSPQADINTLHHLRITLSEVSPALSTVNSHKSECLPTEAVQLMIQLLEHNGSIEGLCPPTPGANGTLVQQNPCIVKDDALSLMSKYSRSRSPSEQQKSFDHVAKLFGI
jgi:hypothetical protein